MVLVKNENFFHSLFLGKTGREILFPNTLDRKEGFFNIKISFQKNGKIRIFAIFLRQYRPGRCIYNILQRKNAFLSYKNKNFKKSKN